MTDEEKSIVYTDNIHIEYNEILSRSEVVDEIRKAYIAGLKAGRETEREYVKNNAFTSMKEQGLFPFGKWHDLRKDPDDIPESHTSILNQEGEKVIYDYINKVWRYDNADEYICETPIAWCEIPTFDKE